MLSGREMRRKNLRADGRIKPENEKICRIVDAI